VDIAELDAELNLLEGAQGRDLSLDASAGAQAIAAFQQHYKEPWHVCKPVLSVL
jgi:hypothetical protein